MAGILLQLLYAAGRDTLCTTSGAMRMRAAARRGAATKVHAAHALYGDVHTHFLIWTSKIERAINEGAEQ